MIRKVSSITLMDVAREAGVSIKTASRVLNDSPELRPATAALVRETMLRLGYQPNELARGLKSKRSAAIAMIAPNLADPFTATAIQAVQEVARTHRHVVILAGSGGDVGLEDEELQAMVRRQIDGIILVAASWGKSTLTPALANRVPIVVLDEPIRGADVDTITVTNRKAAREATEHLLGHRYKRILAVGARPHLFTCAERVAGYRAAVKTAGLEPVELFVKHENDLTADALRNFFSGNRPVDAIFSLNWVCSIRVLRGLKAIKKHVPRDVAFISFDDFDLAEVIPPGLTVVRQPTRQLGYRAATTLFERIGNKCAEGPRRIILPTEFIIRGSCGCPSEC
jgi:LacI family transcriptional regulator, galactose operon repressor